MKPVRWMKSRLQKCPWCGVAAKLVWKEKGKKYWYADWGCGSFKHGKEPWQAPECRVNELEQRLEGRCKTCKHWHWPTPWHKPSKCYQPDGSFIVNKVDTTQGDCHCLSISGDDTCLNAKGMYIDKYWFPANTGPEFGCVHWEKKDA